jgi:hypothetical protein
MDGWRDHGFDMNSSAQTACRKWPIATPGCRLAAMVTIAAAVLAWLALGATPAAARRWHQPDLFGELFGSRPARLRGTVHDVRAAKVPLPMPRPADAPGLMPEPPASAKAAPVESDKPAEQAATATPIPVPRPTPQPSACRLALTEEIAIAPSIPDIHGPGGCGGEDLVRLEAIVLPDKHRVSLKPAATMRCGMAAAIADWVRTDVAPLMQGLGTEPTDLENLDAYECRGRNGISGAPLSEHGRANALDVHAFKLANGQSIVLTDRNVPRGLREAVLHSACARFTTVLGPGSDSYHEDHIHLDLLERRNNYKICQWDVLDPLPQVAPLMPSMRPESAPPRAVAAKADNGKDGKADAASTGSAEPQAKGDKPKERGEAGSDSGKRKTSQKTSESKTSEKTSESQARESKTRESKESESKESESKENESKPGGSKSHKPKSGKPQTDAPATKKRRQHRRF